MKKKIAILLVFVLFLGMLPINLKTSFAEESEKDTKYPTGLEEVKKTIHAGTEEDPIVIIGEDGRSHVIDGSETAVAVIDDAIALDHPGLSVKPKNPKRGDSKVIYIGDYSGEYSDNPILPWDLFHGLHIAGIIGGNGPCDETANAPIFKGIAPETQIIFAKTKDRFGNIAKDNKIVEAIQDSVNAGADVINLSLGSESATSNNSYMLQKAIQEAVNQGVVVVATTGNEGYIGHGVTTPKVNAPDYGVAASPGILKDSLCAMCFDVSKISTRYLTVGNNPKKLRIKDRSYTNSYPDIEGKSFPYIYIHTEKNYYEESDFSESEVKGKFVVLDKYGPEYASTSYGDIAPGYTGAAMLLKDKGALGVIIVEPEGENYYPYEKVLLWNQEKRDYDDAPKEAYEKVEKYPIFGLIYEDGQELINNREGDITISSGYGLYDVPTADQVTEFSSWGVSSDMIFKPDMGGSSGYAVWSLGNYTDKEGKMHFNLIDKRGTSMSAPQLSAASVLVKQRLKLQYPDLVKTDSSTTMLIKNLLMSTSVPMKDKYGVYSSPRSQGNGLLQVKEACLSDVVAISPITDGKDTERGFAKTNLRTISNRVKFDIELQNYGKKAHTFKSPQLYVLTDKIENKRFTMHSKILDNNKIYANIDKNIITVPAREGENPGKKIVSVEFDLSTYDEELKKEAPFGYWIDGFLRFEPLDTNGVALCHSFTGFKGDWIKLPGYDPFIYDLGGEEPLYNIPRLKGLNTTCLTTFMGYDKSNNAIKEVLGALPDFNWENLHTDKNRLAISPNGDDIADYVEPRYVMIRNFKNIKMKVSDEKGNVVFSGDYGTGNTDNGKNFSLSLKPYTESNHLLRWNGKVKNEVIEGLYNINLRVNLDVIDYTNPLNEENNIKDPFDEENFAIKVDVSPAVLLPTKVISKDDKNTVIEINARDQKLNGTDIDGSGIYKAKLITSKGEKELTFNPSESTEIKNERITLSNEEFKNAQIELTDWARNKASYSLSSIHEGMDMGHLSIKSFVPSENLEIGVRYMLENIYSGQLYKRYEDIPVGEYEIIPYDIPEGYIPVDKEQDFEIVIEKDKQYQRTFEYEKTEEIGKLIFSEAQKGSSAQYARRKNIAIALTDIETSTTYLSELSGDSYNFSIPYGTYKIRFLNADKDDKATAYDQENTPASYVKVSGISGTYYKFGFKDDNPGDIKEVKPFISENYYEGKTYIKVTADKDQELTITAYPYNAQEYDYDYNTKLTIDKTNADIFQLNDLTSGNKRDYYIDLHDDVIQKLKAGMLLEVRADDKTGSKHVHSDEVAVVGYNEALNAQKIEHIKLLVQKQHKEGRLSDDEVSSINEKAEDIYTDMVNAAGMVSKHTFIHWNKNNIYYYLDEYIPYYIYDIRQKMEDFEKHAGNLLKIEELYPITYIHGGKLDNVRNILFRVYGDEQEYVGTEDYMTSFVPDEEAIKKASEKLFEEAIKDPDTKENINTDHQNALSMLPIAKKLFIFRNWEGRSIQVKDPDKEYAWIDIYTAQPGISDIFLKGEIQEYKYEKEKLEELKNMIEEAKSLYENEKAQHPEWAAEMLSGRIKKAEDFLYDPILTESAILKELKRLEKAMELFRNSKLDIKPVPIPNPIPNPAPEPIPPYIIGDDDYPYENRKGIDNKADNKTEDKKENKEILKYPNLNIPKPFEKIEFTDISGSVYADEIGEAASRGIIKGVGLGKFDPKGSLKRAMVVEILYRLTVDKTGQNIKFKDVKKSDWFYDSVRWAVKNKIVLGYGDGGFRPHNKVSRQELALIMQRFLQYQSIAFIKERVFNLSDALSIPSWSKDAVYEMYETGVVNARNDKIFGNEDIVKREEFANTVAQIIKKVENK